MPIARLLLRLICVGLLGLLAFGASARAESYLVEGIAAQATGPDPLAARDIAMSKGQRDALETLLKRLAVPGTEARLPRVTDQLVFETMQGFEVQQEKSTASSYSAIINVEFRREAIDRLLAGAGVDYVEAAGKPVVVVPVLIGTDGAARLWEDDNGWRQAWDRRPAGADPLRMVIPLGDLADLQALTAQAAQKGDAAALGTLALRYDADGSLVALGQQGASSITVSVTAPGQPPFYTDTIALGADPAIAFDLAVKGAAAAIQDRYRTQNAVPAGPQASLEAKATFADLRGWRDLKSAVENTAAVKRVNVRRLLVGQAMVAIDYQGDPNSLRTALAQRGVALDMTPTGWQLALGTPTTAVPFDPVAVPGTGPAPVTLSPLPGPGIAAPAPVGSAPPDLLFE